MTPDQHVVIIGPMGSGKTTIGRLIADRLERPFVDNDGVLEATTGKTASEIEHDEGIHGLHAREADVLRHALEAEPPAVITAAASTVLDPELRDRLRDAAFVIWLTAEPTTLARRTTGSSTRPRLAPDPLALAEHQRAERDPFFAEVADLLVSTDASPLAVLDDIVAELPAGVVPSGGGA
jgi:shikimate kinase